MASKPILKDIGNDPITGAEITREPLNQNFQLVNDYAEGVDQDLQLHETSVDAHNSDNILNSSAVSGTKVSDALNNIDEQIETHILSAIAHSGSAITNDSAVSGTKVSDALNTIKTQVDDLVLGDANATIGIYNLNAFGKNDYTSTYSSLTLFADLKVLVLINETNDGDCTLNINALGAKSMVMMVEGVKTQIEVGLLEAGHYYTFVYDGTDFVFFGGQSTKEIEETLDFHLNTDKPHLIEVVGSATKLKYGFKLDGEHLVFIAEEVI